MLLGLADGAVRGQAPLGEDPLAVEIAADGRTAYVSDNAAGAVYAVRLPQLTVRWKTVVGGRPGPILASLDVIYVSLYEAGRVIELESLNGTIVSQHQVGPGPGQLALADGRIQVACADGRVWDLDGRSQAAGRGFGLAATGTGLWSADYDSGTLVRVGDGQQVRLPPGLHPFWLSAGPEDRLLVAAEGADEDRDPGAVLVMDRSLAVTRQLSPRDPDLALEWGGRTYAAAHADHEVTVLGKPAGRVGHWVRGASPVALAADPALGLLVVVTDARE